MSAASGSIYGERPVHEVVRPVDASAYVGLLVQRFGMAPELFEPYVFYRPKPDGVWMVNRDLRVPARPEPHTLGMPFFRTDMRFPRPSTNAALKFGAAATRNVVELEDEEVAQALFRRDVALGSRALKLEGNGYVIVRCRGRALGLGYFAPHPEMPERGVLKTHCPKAWTAKLGIQPPAQRPMPWDEPVASASPDGSGTSTSGTSASERRSLPICYNM